MRPALFCAVFGFATAAFAAPRVLTVVLDIRGPHSSASLEAMKREVETVMRDTGYKFEWPTRQEAASESFANLVLVRFNGKCVLEPVPYLYDERGPLAFTHSTDGNIQPFTEVACDRVASSVRSIMSGGDFAHADRILGRALGRVVAHELVHMLSKEQAHGRTGVAEASLSPYRLVGPELKLSPADLKRLKP